jgi:hypothetical protein
LPEDSRFNGNITLQPEEHVRLPVRSAPVFRPMVLQVSMQHRQFLTNATAIVSHGVECRTFSY